MLLEHTNSRINRLTTNKRLFLNTKNLLPVQAKTQRRVAVSRSIVAEVVTTMIEELDQIETDTDDKQAALRSSLFSLEKTLDPIDAIFMYQVIELTGEIADMAERVGRRLELLLSH